MANYAVIYNDGNLEREDFQQECVKQGWVPIIVLKDKEEKGSVTVPIFTDPKIAHDFMRRNLSPDVVSGLLTIIDKDMRDIKEKGWEIRFFDYPNRFTNHHQYNIGFEIIEGRMGYTSYRRTEQL